MDKASIIEEISISDINGIRLGFSQNEEAGTGVTAIIFENGAKTGCDISGGGPASRETPLTSPVTADNPVNAIILSGGSAFGLAASDGAMKYLEEQKIGFNTGVAIVPLVCQSCIYDLGYKSSSIRPDAAMGYEACKNAIENIKKDYKGLKANDGAGCGATVGKLYGMERASKSGMGIYACKVGSLEISAIVIVNALGDIRDPLTGKTLAGLKNEAGTDFIDSCNEIYKLTKPQNLFTGNTTIGAIITNGVFSKAELNKIASMTRNAYARCIYPVGTMADGDTIYASSVGNVKADINMVGTLAAHAMERAIINAVSVK